MEEGAPAGEERADSTRAGVDLLADRRRRPGLQPARGMDELRPLPGVPVGSTNGFCSTRVVD